TLTVRLAFIALTFFGGMGVLLYALMWLFLPQDPVRQVEAPGLDAASRSGYRTTSRRRSRREAAGQIVAVVMVGIGALVFIQDATGVSGTVFWPLVMGALGLAVLWRQAD